MNPSSTSTTSMSSPDTRIDSLLQSKRANCYICSTDLPSIPKKRSILVDGLAFRKEQRHGPCSGPYKNIDSSPMDSFCIKTMPKNHNKPISILCNSPTSSRQNGTQKRVKWSLPSFDRWAAKVEDSRKHHCKKQRTQDSTTRNAKAPIRRWETSFSCSCVLIVESIFDGYRSKISI